MLNVVMFIVVMPNVVASMEAVRLQGQKLNLFRKKCLVIITKLKCVAFLCKRGVGRCITKLFTAVIDYLS